MMFDKTIQCIAVQLAVLIFFIMACVGWASALSPGTIATRSLGGSVAVYCLVRLAGKLVADVLLRVFVDEQMRRHHKFEQKQG